MSRTKLAAAFTAGLIASSSAFAAIVPLVNELPKGFNISSDYVNIGFDVNFFGNSYSELYVSNLGHIGFQPASQNISPFMSSVNTGNGGAVSYGNLIYEGHLAFGVSWIDVTDTKDGAAHGLSNTFQLLLVDRSDVGEGDFDFIFNYDSIQWGYGDSLGETIINDAWIGYSGGDVDARGHDSFFGYRTQDNRMNLQLLPFDASQLPYNSLNSGVDGRYVFEVRNGAVTNPFLSPVPEPETYAMLLAGLCIVGVVSRRWRTRAAV